MLWQVSRPQPSWEIKGAYEANSTCTSERESAIQALIEPFRGSVTFSEISGQATLCFPTLRPPLLSQGSRSFFYLPDTIDPRGPRGK